MNPSATQSPPEKRSVILVALETPGDVVAELRRRFSADYAVVVADGAPDATVRLREAADEGRRVALVLGDSADPRLYVETGRASCRERVCLVV